MEIDIGWVDSWQIRDRKYVHPSHETQVIVIKDLIEWIDKQFHGFDNIELVIERLKELSEMPKRR